MRTLIVVAVVALACGRPAQASIQLGDHEHQRDLPASAMELVVLDPETGLPLELPGPEGKPVLASPQLVPLGAVVLVNPVVDLGERRLDRVEYRLDGVPVRIVRVSDLKSKRRTVQDPGGRIEVEEVLPLHSPLEWEIPTRDLRPGMSHAVQALVIRTDGRYTSAFEKFWLDATPLEAYRPKAAANVKPEDPLFGLAPATTEQTFFCSYNEEVAPIQLGDQLVAKMNGRVVGLLEVTHLDRFGYQAKLIAGEAPAGAELYFLNGGR